MYVYLIYFILRNIISIFLHILHNIDLLCLDRLVRNEIPGEHDTNCSIRIEHYMDEPA